MKNYLSQISIISILVLLFSCTDDNINENELELENKSMSYEKFIASNEFKDNISRGVQMSCSGSCGCQVILNIETSQARCSCGDCAMTITLDPIGNKTNTSNTNLDYYKSYILSNSFFLKTNKIGMQSISKNYNIKNISFSEIVYFESDLGQFITYVFIDGNGQKQTVSYSHDYSTDKSFEIDCKGSCDCREQYDLINHVASCSCSSCTMTVTEVSMGE